MNSTATPRTRLLVAAIALALPCAPVVAGAHDDAKNVRDVGLEKLERKLESRGYDPIGETRASGVQFWWNREKDDCLEVFTRDGFVSHAEVRDEKLCRKANKEEEALLERSGARGSSGLVGMRAGSLDEEMEARGYRAKGGYKDADTAYTNWWSASTRECLAVAVHEGRVENVRTVSEGNCK